MESIRTSQNARLIRSMLFFIQSISARQKIDTGM